MNIDHFEISFYSIDSLLKLLKFEKELKKLKFSKMFELKNKNQSKTSISYNKTVEKIVFLILILN